MEEAHKKPEPGEDRHVAKVKMSIAYGDGVTESDIIFNTPSMLNNARLAKDGSRIKITVTGGDTDDTRVLVDGTKEEVISALVKSIVPPEQVGVELRKFTQFLIEHSTMKAVGVCSVCVDESGDDTGIGFAATAADCTVAQAVSLVNCCDANMHEFVSKAKLDIPGKDLAPEKGTVITPTPDQIKELG